MKTYPLHHGLSSYSYCEKLTEVCQYVAMAFDYVTKKTTVTYTCENNYQCASSNIMLLHVVKNTVQVTQSLMTIQLKI